MADKIDLTASEFARRDRVSAPEKLHVEIEIFHRMFVGEARTAIADDIINGDGWIVNKYRWARDDILLIQRRYVCFLDEMAKSRRKEKSSRRNSPCRNRSIGAAWTPSSAA